MKHIENFDDLKEISENCDIYIFGADIVGKILKLYLDQHNIGFKAFLDNNGNKCRERIENASIFQAHPKGATVESRKKQMSKFERAASMCS